MKRLSIVLALFAAFILTAQVRIEIIGGPKGAIAIPDFRGSGDAQKYMATFNRVLWDSINDSGLFKMVPKTTYPLYVPQQPQDFRPAPPPGAARPTIGSSLQDWSGPPVNANYMAFGFTAVVEGQLVLSGWFYNVSQNDLANAQVIGKRYFGTLDDAGARKVALDFANDILKQFGQEAISNTRVYFVSDRTGHKEIWAMDWDGANQKQITSYRSIT